MGCYVVPVLAGLVHYGLVKKGFIKGQHQSSLGLMFLGGALFGVVDHAWNNELLSFSAADILLGVVITAVIVLSWTLVAVERLKLSKRTDAGA